MTNQIPLCSGIGTSSQESPQSPRSASSRGQYPVTTLGKGFSLIFLLCLKPRSWQSTGSCKSHLIRCYQRPKHQVGAGALQQPVARGQFCESQHPGALHRPAWQSMAQHSALSAFLELMGWLFQSCGEHSISYWLPSSLLARAFGEGSGVAMGETRLSINPTGSG